MLKVNEIFSSIEGEGKRTGYLTTFIRLAGCNLRCSYCDTKYAQTEEEYTLMSSEDIVSKIKTDCVTLTGGEPLIHQEVEKLISDLMIADKFTNIETNGSVFLAKFIELRYKLRRSKFFFTMDIKCPSSGMHKNNNFENLKLLNNLDVIKFVVGSEEDLYYAKTIIESIKTEAVPYISPVFGFYPPLVVDFIKENDLKAVFQLQLHKYIWDPNKRGV
jgi:7-carboxy-7-deazaguanine synthase